MINGNKISYEDSGLGKREWNELMEVIDKKNLIVI
jgi:thymidylate synthase (FAD)